MSFNFCDQMKIRKVKSFSVQQIMDPLKNVNTNLQFTIKRKLESRKRHPQQNMFLQNYQNTVRLKSTNKLNDNQIQNQRVYFNNLAEIPIQKELQGYIKKDTINQLLQKCKIKQNNNYIHQYNIQELPQIQNHIQSFRFKQRTNKITKQNLFKQDTDQYQSENKKDIQDIKYDQIQNNLDQNNFNLEKNNSKEQYNFQEQNRFNFKEFNKWDQSDLLSEVDINNYVDQSIIIK